MPVFFYCFSALTLFYFSWQRQRQQNIHYIQPKINTGMMKGIIITLLMVILVGSGYFYWKYYFTYSDGNRTGLLQKFSRKGNLFKTYEGELVLSSLISNGNMTLSAEKFFFSVENKVVAQQLMGFEGQKIVVHYEEKKGTLPWRGDSFYLVDSVRLVNP